MRSLFGFRKNRPSRRRATRRKQSLQARRRSQFLRALHHEPLEPRRLLTLLTELGHVDYTIPSSPNPVGAEIDVDPTRDLVYISAGMAPPGPSSTCAG